MSILIVSDLHFEHRIFHGVEEGGALEWLLKTSEKHKPSTVIMLGDSGYGFLEEDWNALTEKVHVKAIYGNHEYVDVLKWARNTDKTRVHMKDGEMKMIEGLKFGFINGIVSDRKSSNREFVPRSTKADFNFAAKYLENIDVFCTHESPMFDELKGKMHFNPGTLLLTDIIKQLNPKMSFSGHMHIKAGYLISHISNTLSFLVDSSGASRHYALIHTNSSTVDIYKDEELVESVEY
jgi:predicted phosphodiesterase